jgi:radical SAM/Cys-rich protein
MPPRRLSLVAERHPLAAPAAQRARLAVIAQECGAPAFDARAGAIRASTADTLQMNIGKRCNQTCAHCHVDAGPDRSEQMSDDVIDACLTLAERSPSIATVDITGGAPELHPRFESLVTRARALGKHVIDRCNLTVLLLAQKRHLAEFLARHHVEVACSLPFYEQGPTDAQRGDGVFAKSIEALRMLNAAGYARSPAAPALTIVSNPSGAFLPPPQAQLEADMRRALAKHGVTFTRVSTLANLPIARTLEWLDRTDNGARYVQKLVDAFNPEAAARVMCRTTLSIGWDGAVYDCDFNQMLALPAQPVVDVRSLARAGADGLTGRAVVTGPHCFGCTAGQGSSCGGALA